MENSPKGQDSHKNNIMYLLTEWEGRTGKYLARGHGVRTERSAAQPKSVTTLPEYSLTSLILTKKSGFI